MMISMTGFGKTTCELKDKNITIEIKSLNSKQLDIYTRLPFLYKDKDLEIRNYVSQKLKRGKIDFNLNIENTEITNSSKINVALVKEYYSQMKEISNELEVNSDNNRILQTVMRFPDVLKTDKEELDESDWKKLLEKIDLTLCLVDAYRSQEGAVLEKDIILRIQLIENLLLDITPFEDDRMKKLREKIYSGFTDIYENDKIDNNRFEQELIYYIEKLDITEEKVRLKNHCNFFKEVCSEEEPVGKKLGFIAQEIGREINTIGSKANHSDIQRIVVQMKDELEKIKEQLMNVL
jgi:uncharacterized protein (TIGR00255 family)